MSTHQKPAPRDRDPDAQAASMLARYRGWKLEDAKARFSELVRRAHSEGPQRVTVRGKDAVVIISVEELKRLLPQEKKSPLRRVHEESLRRGFGPQP